MKSRCLLILSVALFAPALGRACTVPVFRYALERWDLAKYEIVVFYERTLPPELDKELKKLEAGAPLANYVVVRVDLHEKVAPEYAKQWAMQSDKKSLPWLTARLPESSAKLPDAWAGQFTPQNLQRLLDSPVRQRLVKRLSEGTTAVFLLLPGADEQANAKARQLLDAELPRLAKVVQLPDLKPEDKLRSAIPFKVEFSTITLNRNDPAEQALIQTLLNTDEDLAKVRGPIVLPVFGRGRLLCSLFGEDLTRDNLTKVVAFMCGECSCTLKELNPGVDLLIAGEWVEILSRPAPPVANSDASPPSNVVEATSSPAPATDVVPIAASSGRSSEEVIVPPSVSAAETSDCGECVVGKLTNHRWLLGGVGGAGLLVLVTGVWAWKGSRRL